MLQSTEVSDWDLLKGMNEGEINAFTAVYAKYAAMMYGCTLEICKEEHQASQIFKTLFLNLRHVKMSKNRSSFAFWLWQYTGSETKNLIKSEQAASHYFDSKESIIDFMCFTKVGRKEAAEFFNLDNKDIALRVRKELQTPN